MYRSQFVSDPGLPSTIRGVQNDIKDIMHSGRYYCTNEIANELSNINNALDHLHLDRNILSTSDSFRFDHGKTATENSHAAALLSQAAGYLNDFKSKMSETSLRGKQENEVRELHQWTVNNLRGIQQAMDDITFTAADRIRQFGDHAGVTDRYTGYRQNLTRGSREPFRLQTKWMDKNAPQGYMDAINSGRPWTAFQPRTTNSIYYGEPSEVLKSRVRFGSALPHKRDIRGYQTIDSLYPRSNSMYVDPTATSNEQLQRLKHLNSLNNPTTNDHLALNKSMAATEARGLKNLSIQEQAGINTTFPGRTEYMTKYTCPPMDIPTSDFTINPKPDFTLHQRPLGTTTFDRNITEYQSRYEFPDSEKIVRLPWLRK